MVTIPLGSEKRLTVIIVYFESWDGEGIQTCGWCSTRSKLYYGGRSMFYAHAHTVAARECLPSAVKILTTSATDAHEKGLSQEVCALERLSQGAMGTQNCQNFVVSLFSTFTISGAHGQHLCLVMPALAQTVQDFSLKTPDVGLPIRAVQRIIAFALGALDRLHSRGIIHTGMSSTHEVFMIS